MRKGHVCVCVGFDRDLQRTMHFCISAGRTLLHLDPHRHPKAKGLFNRDNSQLTVKPLACLILATARQDRAANFELI